MAQNQARGTFGGNIDNNAIRHGTAKTRNHNWRIPANYNLFVSPTLFNNNTRSRTASDVTVDSLRLHCSIIRFDVMAESKQIIQRYTAAIKSSSLTDLDHGEGKAGDSNALLKQKFYIMFCLLGN